MTTFLKIQRQLLLQTASTTQSNLQKRMQRNCFGRQAEAVYRGNHRFGCGKNLQNYSFTKAFIGANGISEKQGYTTPDTEEAMLKAVTVEKAS